MTGRDRRLPAAAALAVAVLMPPAGCAEERVEYRYRPAYATAPDAPKEARLPDGTRIVFVDRDRTATTLERSGAVDVPAPPPPTLGPDGKPVPVKVFEPREVLDDGTVVLRCIMPDHVVANAMTCFRNEEYRLVWDQLLAPEAVARWERNGGFEAFERWCRANRRYAMELLNRMRFNAVGSDVAMKQLGGGRMRATLSPHLWDQFQLRVIEFEQTPDGMKLLSIRPSA